MIRRHTTSASREMDKPNEFDTFGDRFNTCFRALLVSIPSSTQGIPLINDDA